jgi:hypothetical protein
METRRRRLTLVLSAVIALICLVGFLAAPRLLDRLWDAQWEVIFRFKTARHTTATAVRMEHRVNAPPGEQWVVYYRVTGFPIYSFHRRSSTNEWEQGGLDSDATRKLDIAQRRSQQSGDRETHVSQKDYDSLSVGDRLDVSYRLRADGESVEIINVERANP